MPPLSYSTNLHAAESPEQLLAEVLPFAGALRRELGWSALGLDLRLGFMALQLPTTAFRRACASQGLVVHSVNAFPLEPFQAPVVKERAYHPDWTDGRRLAATTILMDRMLELSDEKLLTLSTVPGSFAPWGASMTAVAQGLIAAARHARRIEERTGRRIVLALEPEPWCMLETSWQAVDFWRRHLMGWERWLGLCFDTCHTSLAFEDPVEAIGRLRTAGIPLVKAQVSAAPEATDASGLEALSRLAEPRFLHQTALRGPGGSMVRCQDLDGLHAAVARLPQWTQARSHFHMPLHAALPDLGSTAPESRRAVAALREAGCTHLGVETYTWPLLAPSTPDILAGTAQELRELASWDHD